jgi:VIT1/CCC1 family predicted Fe2+/Mn2+ transporter
MGVSDSASWKWRLIVRFFGTMLMLIPFFTNMPAWNMAYAVLSVIVGFLLIMVS